MPALPSGIHNSVAHISALVYHQRVSGKSSFFVEALFSWEVLGLGVSILIAVGFTLAADEFRQFRAARVCFTVTALWLFGKVAMWGISTSEKFGVRAGVTALVCVIVGIGLVEAVRLTVNREAEVGRSEAHQVPTSLPAPATSPGTREFTNRTPRELLAFYENVTPLQGDSLMTPFKGLWIKVAGRVETVVDAGGGGAQVTLIDHERVRSACTFQRQWREALSRLSKNDKISATGRISDGQNGSTLYLLDCELVRTLDEDTKENKRSQPPKTNSLTVVDRIDKENQNSVSSTFSLERLSKTMSNPRYADDIFKLDRTYDKKAVINEQTVIIVVGASIVAELLDRPTAELLRDHIDHQGGNYPFRRGIVITHDAWYEPTEAKAVGNNPVIAVGGPKTNRLTAEFDEWKPNSPSKQGSYSIPVSGTRVGTGFFRTNQKGLPQVALWGYGANAVRETVEHYLRDERGLAEFLKMCWK